MSARTNQAAPPNAPSGAGANPWLIAVLVAVASFMETLDTTIANVLLNYIAGGPGGQRGRGLLGGDDLSCRQRRQSDREHLPHSAPRPQDLLPDLSGAVYREFGVVRLCLESRRAAAVPHCAGPRRRRHGASRAVDIGRCVSA